MSLLSSWTTGSWCVVFGLYLIQTSESVGETFSSQFHSGPDLDWSFCEEGFMILQHFVKLSCGGIDRFPSVTNDVVQEAIILSWVWLMGIRFCHFFGVILSESFGSEPQCSRLAPSRIAWAKAIIPYAVGIDSCNRVPSGPRLFNLIFRI